MKLKIQNEVIEVSEEKKTYCLMLKEFQTKVREVKEFYEKGYKKFGNLKNLVEGIGELTDDTIEEAYKSVAYLYEKYAKIKINSDMFYKLFLPKMEECFGKFDDYYNEKYDEFDQARQDKMAYRQARMDNRERWVGYNKAGQQEANARNFRSWAAHSARNTVGNTATNISTNMKMNEVYKDKEMIKEQLDAVGKFCCAVFDYYLNEVKKMENVPIEVIYSKDYQEAEKNFKEVKKMEVGSAESLTLIKKSIETAPNKMDVYQYIISNYGDPDNAICEFAKEVGIYLENWKEKQAEEQVKKDKVNDLSSEKKILDVIAVIEKDCHHYGVCADTYTEELKKLWNKVDEKLRTVEGILYETREESDAVRKDINYLWEYSMQNNMLGEKFDLQSVVGEISANIKTEAVKNNLAERINNLAAWQNLKNIQHASMEIASACPVYDKIKGELWFGDLFSYGKSFENLRVLFEDNNKNAVLYDNGIMNKGKTGLLFASNGIYFYSKDGIETIWLEDYEGIELSQGEIIIHRKTGDAIKTGIQIKIEQLNSFMVCDLFDTIVRMCRTIKNKDQVIEDTEVYFTVSREKSNKKVNKEDLTQEDRQLLLGKKIWIGILIVVVAVIFMFIFGKGKKDSTPATSTNVENITTDETKDEITTPVQSDTEEDTYSDAIIENADIDESDEDNEEESTPFLVQGVDPYYYEKFYILYSDDGNSYVDLFLNLVDESGIYGEYSIYSYDEDIICSGELLGGWVQDVKDKIEASNEDGTFDLWFQDNETVVLQWNDIRYKEVDGSNDDLYSEYILPDSDSVYIQTSTLEDLTAEQCKLARNEIYARHGRRFNDESIQEYFDQCSWYEGTTAPEDFSEDVLNDYEITNLQTISNYEEEMGYK